MNSIQIGRLAMRKEGLYWCAYYALPNDMAGAILLGSIRIQAIVENPERKQVFMDMMREIISEILEDELGQSPAWGGPISAPKHEQSGEA